MCECIACVILKRKTVQTEFSFLVRLRNLNTFLSFTFYSFVSRIYLRTLVTWQVYIKKKRNKNDFTVVQIKEI